MSKGRLNPGLTGNIQTVELMKQVAHYRKGHPVIRRLAEEIIFDYQIPSHNRLDEMIAIGKFVRDHVRYVKDPNGIEYVQDPLLMIERLQEGKATGDCDDQSVLGASLMLALGHNPFFKIIRYQGYDSGFQHIYLYAKESNNEGPEMHIPIDPILKDKKIGYEVPHVKSELFIV